MEKIWNRLLLKLKTSYRKNHRIYYSISLSFLIHLILLALLSIFFLSSLRPKDITIGISLESDEVLAETPIPDNGQIPATIEEQSNIPPLPLPTVEHLRLDITDKPEIPTESKIPTAEDWKRELSEIPLEHITPKLPNENALEEEIEKLLAEEKKIHKQLDKRQKLSYQSTSKISAKTLQEGRTKGRSGLLQIGGGNEATQTAVDAGLRWLSRHQNKKGYWDCDGFQNDCTGCTCRDTGVSWGDPAVTGFALLCFLGAGGDDISGKYSENIRNGLNYLLEIQDYQDGCIGPKIENYMYNHAIATMAMTEGYLMCHDIKYRQAAIQAHKFLVQAQTPNAGWRYRQKCGDTDTSVTGWCMLALKTAQTAEIQIPERSIRDAKYWLDKVTCVGEEPWVGYVSQQYGSVCMTSVGTLCRIFFYETKDKINILGAANILLRNLPSWRASNDFYYWYYGTLVMYQLGGTSWQEWNKALQKSLLDHQDKTGCSAGSWGSGMYSGGRIFWTSLNILSLQVYYRYPRFFLIEPQSEEKEESIESEALPK